MPLQLHVSPCGLNAVRGSVSPAWELRRRGPSAARRGETTSTSSVACDLISHPTSMATHVALVPPHHTIVTIKGQVFNVLSRPQLSDI